MTTGPHAPQSEGAPGGTPNATPAANTVDLPVAVTSIGTDTDTLRRALRVLSFEPVGHLGVVAEGRPYVVPISFAVALNFPEGAQAGPENAQAASPENDVAAGTARLVFHGGHGRRAEALAQQAWACLNVVSQPTIIRGETACRVNFAYESVIVSGSVHRIRDEALKTKALQLLVAKYYPARRGEPLPHDLVARTLVYVMEIEELSYRSHRQDA